MSISHSHSKRVDRIWMASSAGQGFRDLWPVQNEKLFIRPAKNENERTNFHGHKIILSKRAELMADVKSKSSQKRWELVCYHSSLCKLSRNVQYAR